MSDQYLLGPFVRRFLLEEIIADRNLSRNTQKSYRDVFRILFRFMEEYYSTNPTHLTVADITVDAVRSFLKYLRQKRGNSDTTVNQRLTTIHSFFSFLARQVPELIEHATQIQNIPLRRTDSPTIDYLEKPEIDALLATPNRRSPQGQRDYALILFLYNTGARATEAAQLAWGALSLNSPPSVQLFGKGRKSRLCPLWDHTTVILRNLLGLHDNPPPDAPVFLNVRGHSITRFGIYRLVERATIKAAQSVPSLNQKRVSPHSIRHTTAVHLLRSGVDINTIRAWLGHVTLKTTNRYAEVDLHMKAKALETCAVSQGRSPLPFTGAWHKDQDLMAFLTSL